MATVVSVDPVERWITISGAMDSISTAAACERLAVEVAANPDATWTVDCTIARHHRDTLAILRTVQAALGPRGKLSVAGARPALKEILASDGI